MLRHFFPTLFSSDEELLKNDEKLKLREINGTIPDSEKIRLLKEKLYRVAMDDESTIDLRCAIDCLQAGLDAENRERNSFNSQLSGISNSLFFLAILVTGLSYAIAPKCQNTSQFCRDARAIPDAIARYIK